MAKAGSKTKVLPAGSDTRLRLKESDYAEALRKSGGWITQAAELLGVTHQAVSKRVKESETLQAVLAETKEQHLDLAESKVIEAMKRDEAWAICFYLKCQGKKRGWVERQEVSGPDGGPVQHRHDLPPDLTNLLSSISQSFLKQRFSE